MKLNKLMARVGNLMFRCSETFLDPHALFKACSDRRMEGIVSKRVDRPYQSGPSQDWIKVKCAECGKTTAGGTNFFAQAKN